MQSKREYLVGLGLAKDGRGKFSNAAKEALVKAEASGMTFSDINKVIKPTGASAIPAEPVEIPKPKASDSLYVSPSDFRFPEDNYKAIGSDGKTYGMREGCNTCGVSLTNHACNTPSVFENITVRIVAK